MGTLVDLLREHLDHALLVVLGSMSFVLVWLVTERLLYLRRVDPAAFPSREDLEIALTRHLTAIASIGASAPFVGLLGTVLGILVTFHDLGTAERIDVRTVMVGLALALQATALGLVVAIPAVLAYNGLSRRVEVLLARHRDGAGTEG